MKILLLLLLFSSLFANNEKLTYKEAVVYCISIGKRLPNQNELEKIIPQNGKNELYWSSSTGGDNGAWLVGSGEIRYSYQVKTNKYNVKCI